MLSWDVALAYCQANDRLHSHLDLQFRDVHEVKLNGDQHVVLAAMEWPIRFRDDAVEASGAAFRHRGKATVDFNHVLSL